MRERVVRQWLRMGALVALTAASCVLAPAAKSRADAHISGSAAWSRGAQAGQASLSVRLAGGESLGDITAVQVNVSMETADLNAVKSVKFVFDSGWPAEIKDTVYDADRGLLTVVIAGNSKIMDVNVDRSLGTLKVDAAGGLKAVVSGGAIVADGELYTITFVQESTTVLYEGSTGGGGSGSGSGGGTGGSGSGGGWSGGGSGGSWSGSGSGGSRGVGPTGKGTGGVYQEPFGQAVETRGNWEKTGTSWRFRLSTGSYARDTWVYKGGLWYHIGADSIMNTGWYQQNGIWYFLRDDGHMKRGWLDDAGVWYYLEEDSGKMRTGWLQNGGWWYYLSGSGAMCTGWQIIDNKYYYFNSTAPAAAGQRPVGAMYASAVTPDGYTVDVNGVWQDASAQSRQQPSLPGSPGGSGSQTWTPKSPLEP